MLELAKRFIDKECVITSFDGNHNFDGVIKEVSNGAVLIEKDGKRLLYMHDTDLPTEADMAFLKDRRMDLISMDCTNGIIDSDYIGHMGISDNLKLREMLLENGTADENTTFVANHFSHNGLAPHEEMEKRLPGFTVTYDGLTLMV